eukprot:PhF_6_TR19937/c0_g1_i1/m.29008
MTRHSHTDSPGSNHRGHPTSPTTAATTIPSPSKSRHHKTKRPPSCVPKKSAYNFSDEKYEKRKRKLKSKKVSMHVAVTTPVEEVVGEEVGVEQQRNALDN